MSSPEENWNVKLPYILMALRAANNVSTGLSHSELMTDWVADASVKKSGVPVLEEWQATVSKNKSVKQ